MASTCFRLSFSLARVYDRWSEIIGLFARLKRGKSTFTGASPVETDIADSIWSSPIWLKFYKGIFWFKIANAYLFWSIEGVVSKMAIGLSIVFERAFEKKIPHSQNYIQNCYIASCRLPFQAISP